MAAGGALVLIGVVYIVQLSRLADDADVSLGDVFGIGPAATIVGGLAVLVAAGR
jgi:hypothetical protein